MAKWTCKKSKKRVDGEKNTVCQADDGTGEISFNDSKGNDVVYVHLHEGYKNTSMLQCEKSKSYPGYFCKFRSKYTKQ